MDVWSFFVFDVSCRWEWDWVWVSFDVGCGFELKFGWCDVGC